MSLRDGTGKESKPVFKLRDGPVRSALYGSKQVGLICFTIPSKTGYGLIYSQLVLQPNKLTSQTGRVNTC